MKTTGSLFLLFLSLSTFAQQNAIFYDKYFSETDDKDKKYYRQVFQPDSNLFLITDFHITGEKYAIGYATEFPEKWKYERQGRYLKFHKNLKVAESGIFKDGLQIGIGQEFYDNGEIFKRSRYTGEEDEIPKVTEVYSIDGEQLVIDGNGTSKEVNFEKETQNIGQYIDGLKEGDWLNETFEGKKRYVDTYKHGKLKRGVSYDSSGEAYSYKEISESATFKGGVNAMYSFINHEIRYPANAQRSNIEGAVWLRFTIDSSGNIVNPKIIKSVSPGLDAEAKRVIKKMKGHWIPGEYRGQPSSVFFTMPIHFQLE
ncbi:energy transducer TonB [uncultured Arcticibacterium sp.]|uniref:energy transducer TonB n=1 Tax=uncultured Arcticibacterium sp. TaxID=2173042 RepID=UPI0030FD0783